MKRNTNDVYNASYTVQSEEIEEAQPSKRKKNIVLVIEIILAAAICGGAILLYTVSKNKNDTTQVVKAYTPISTPAPTVTDSDSDYQENTNDAPYALIDGTEIYKKNAPVLYEYLTNCNDNLDIQELEHDDFVDQNGAIYVEGYSPVGKVTVTMSVEPISHNNMTVQTIEIDDVTGDGPYDYVTTKFSYAVLDQNFSEIASYNQPSVGSPAISINLDEGETSYLFCMSENHKSLFVFPIGQGIIDYLKEYYNDEN